jgi:hypothetical protein
MDPVSAASVTNVQAPVGDGNTGFNGGLVGVANLLYGIGNNSNNFATLFSFQTDGQALTPVSSDFNTSGPATGWVFQNGLGAIGNTFYGIGANTTGQALFQIGNGSATQIQMLNTFGGTYAGLAWDPALSDFYAIIAGATAIDFHGDLLVRFAFGGPVIVMASLSSLDGELTGTHLGGLADVGGGTLYDIFTNSTTFTGELEQITVNGPVSVATLYDTGIPLAQNAGIAFTTATTPEPATGVELIGGLILVCGLLKRRSNRNTE